MGLCSEDKYNIHCARTCGFCKKELQNEVELEESKFFYHSVVKLLIGHVTKYYSYAWIVNTNLISATKLTLMKITKSIYINQL